MEEYLPSKGETHWEAEKKPILVKPRLMPLKSVTLEKLEKMQKEAEQKVKESG
jgi:BBSome-interacting protein 1